jgi:hypothetical protein
MRRREPLEVECLRDGSLDVDLRTGEVFSVRHGVPRERKTWAAGNGYIVFGLNRDRPDGKISKGDRGRRRVRRTVLVHRLVKIKHLAVARGGRNWRQFVAPLPLGVDVNHIDHHRDHNHSSNLELSTQRANRGQDEMTEQEYEQLAAAG